MEVVVLPTPDAVARLAADAVEQVLRSRPHPVLGLATGSTPLGAGGAPGPPGPRSGTIRYMERSRYIAAFVP